MATNKTDIIKFLTLSGFLLALLLFVPGTIALLKGGFTDQTIDNTFGFYMVTGGVAFLIIVCFVLIEGLITKDDEKYGNGNSYYSVGSFPAAKFWKRFTIPQITLIFVIIFSILEFGITVNAISHPTTQTVFADVAVLPQQQFTGTDNLIFSSFLVTISETLDVTALFVMLYFFLRRVARKYECNPIVFRLLCYITIPALSTIFAITWHFWRYSSSEVALSTTAIFWLIGGLFSVFTGVLTVFWGMHFVNNVFYDLTASFSNQLVIVITGLSIVAMIVFYFWHYGNKKAILGSKIQEIQNSGSFQSIKE